MIYVLSSSREVVDARGSARRRYACLSSRPEETKERKTFSSRLEGSPDRAPRPRPALPSPSGWAS
eukprot:26869-Pelagococcus_subviridis.AAC.5